MQFITVEGLMCVCSAVNTKVDVRFHVDSAEWVPNRVKERLKTMVRAWLCTSQTMLYHAVNRISLSSHPSSFSSTPSLIPLSLPLVQTSHQQGWGVGDLLTAFSFPAQEP